MPYKDPIVAKQKMAEKYQKKKYLWKNPDGTWKKSYKDNPEQRNVKKRERYHGGYRVRHQELQKKYRDAKRIIGTCPICLKNDKHLCRDHCHTTNHIRGYICLSCNLLLGHAFDNVRTLLSAIKYLEGFYDRH